MNVSQLTIDKGIIYTAINSLIYYNFMENLAPTIVSQFNKRDLKQEICQICTSTLKLKNVGVLWGNGK